MKRQGFFPPSQHAKTHANRGRKRENRRIIIQNSKKYTGYCHVLYNIPYKWCGRQELNLHGVNHKILRISKKIKPLYFQPLTTSLPKFIPKNRNSFSSNTLLKTTHFSLSFYRKRPATGTALPRRSFVLRSSRRLFKPSLFFSAVRFIRGLPLSPFLLLRASVCSLSYASP